MTEASDSMPCFFSKAQVRVAICKSQLMTTAISIQPSSYREDLIIFSRHAPEVFTNVQQHYCFSVKVPLDSSTYCVKNCVAKGTYITRTSNKNMLRQEKLWKKTLIKKALGHKGRLLVCNNQADWNKLRATELYRRSCWEMLHSWINFKRW